MREVGGRESLLYTGCATYSLRGRMRPPLPFAASDVPCVDNIAFIVSVSVDFIRQM